MAYAAAVERLLVDQLVHHTGEVETTRRGGSSQKTPLFAASVEIGKACVTLTRKRVTRSDYPLLLGPPRRILEAVRRNRTTSSATRDQARILELGARMIEQRNFPTQIGEIQGELERETAMQLDRTVKALEGIDGRSGERRRGTLNGLLAELTGLGLMNYGDIPDHFGIFALPHHDQMRVTKRNRDAIFCQNTGDSEITQALQFKLRCEGFCGRIAAQDDRIRYTPDIALVSGHCDLGLLTDYDTRAIDLTVPKLLVAAELDPDALWSNQRRRLDELSEGLVHTITHEGTTSRAGTARN